MLRKGVGDLLVPQLGLAAGVARVGMRDGQVETRQELEHRPEIGHHPGVGVEIEGAREAGVREPVDLGAAMAVGKRDDAVERPLGGAFIRIEIDRQPRVRLAGRLGGLGRRRRVKGARRDIDHPALGRAVAHAGSP